MKADERNRSSASQLLEHSFITPALSNGLPNGHQEAVRNNGIVGNDGPSFLVDQPEHEEPVPDFSFFSGVPGKSRVKCEFEELQFLGKGGFGNVIKVCAFSVVMKGTKTDSNQAKSLRPFHIVTCAFSTFHQPRSQGLSWEREERPLEPG